MFALMARFGLVLFLYFSGLLFSLWLAYQIKFDFAPEPSEIGLFWRLSLWIIPLQLVALFVGRQMTGLFSYFGVPDLKRLFVSLLSASGLVGVVWVATEGANAPPRSIILLDFILSFLAVSALRLYFRLQREQAVTSKRESSSARGAKRHRVVVIGAGDAGSTLVRELLAKRHSGLKPVLFLDDDQLKWNTRMHDIPVLGPIERIEEFKTRYRLDRAIIAMPSAPGTRIREIVKAIQKAGLTFETVPSLENLATGKVKVSQIRPVEIQDLLGREAVKLETGSILNTLRDKIVMVTGAGGSIGSELCRQIASFQPKRVVLVEQSEVQLYQIEQELADTGFGAIITPVVADILDYARMEDLFEKTRPELVFHAAAHKHVPIMELHPSEAIKNNSLGTSLVAELALKTGAERFVFVSTDKAINPTNVMGATKRLAEIFLQAFSAHHRNQTKFMAVRFGNVLGSSGSVVPAFRRQIAAGGPVKVTHPEVTRYFMTIPEAVGLVLQCATQGQGGEIFVLDMGKPVKVLDLARNMIELSGLTPDVDIEIEFVGLRPGEKLYEELSYQDERHEPTSHPKIMRFVGEPQSYHTVHESLQNLWTKLATATPEELKRLLKEYVPEYDPQTHFDDVLKFSRESTLPAGPIAADKVVNQLEEIR